MISTTTITPPIIPPIRSQLVEGTGSGVGVGAGGVGAGVVGAGVVGAGVVGAGVVGAGVVGAGVVGAGATTVKLPLNPPTATL